MNLKSFSKNTIIYSIGTITLRFTTFLLIPLYTHYLSQSEFGLLQTLFLTIQIIITINDFGMRSALMRFFAEFEQKNKLNELLGSSFSINVFVGILFLLSSFAIPDSLISSFFKTDLIPNIILFTFIVGVGQTLSLNILSYFRAKDQGLKYMIVSLITAIGLIVLTYLFLVEFDYGILGILWAQSITFFTMWIIVLLWIQLKHGLIIKTAMLKILFRFGFPLIFAMSGDMIINTYGSYLLGHFENLEEVAVFSLAYKIASIGIMVLIGPFQMAYEPYVFRNKSNKELNQHIARIALYMLLAFIIVSWSILFVFRDLINIMGPQEYYKAYYLIFLILPGIGSTVFNYIGQSQLHINNKTRTTGSVIIFSTVLTLILLYFLIIYYGMNGLIIGINFYLIFSSALLFYFGNKEFPIKLDYERFFIILFIGILLFIGVYKLSFYNDFIYYSLSPILLVIIVFFLYQSNFFSEQEKMGMTIFFKNLKLKR